MELGPPAIGATALWERVLAPDLARGAMLLLIALANVPLYLYGDGSFGYGMWVRGVPALDQVIVFVETALVKGRAYPMFALLFGYGIVQLQRRLTSTGVGDTEVRKLVRRRGGWLVLLGFLHALLLFSGDIVGAYGVLAVLLAGVVIRARERTLLVLAGFWLVPVVLFPPLESLVTLPGPGSNARSDALGAAGIRVLEWVQRSVVGSLFLLVPALLFGVWAARRRFLDEPDRHHRLLRRTAVLGVGIAAAGGLPWALVKAQWWRPPSATADAVAGVAHTLTGYPGGVGYAAVAGLVAIRVRHRAGRVVTALVACGQRSLTCYLLQSVVFVGVLAAYGGGLGNRFGIAELVVLAVATWVLTVLVAESMRRRGYRGPAEVLLRRLTYRPVRSGGPPLGG